MSIRDLLLNILIGIGLFTFFLGISVLDALPFWVILVIVFMLWFVYIIICIRDHTRDIRYPLVRVRSEPPLRTPKTPQHTPYDQEEDKQ